MHSRKYWSAKNENALYIPIVYKPLVWYYLYKEQAQRISSNFAYKLELVINT